MWSDNETDRDLLNFQHVADIAAERILGAAGRPLSIGISGGWGMGKSSMMGLLRLSMARGGAELEADAAARAAQGRFTSRSYSPRCASNHDFSLLAATA